MSGNTLDIATEGLLQTGTTTPGCATVVKVANPSARLTTNPSENHVVTAEENSVVHVVNPTVAARVSVKQAPIRVQDRRPVIKAGSNIGATGPKGAPGATIPKIEFAYGDAAGVVWTPTDAGVLTYVRIVVRTAFNGAPSTLAVGTLLDPEAAMPTAYSDLSMLQEFENTPDIHLAAGEAIYLTIAPGAGASQGGGWLLLTFLPD